MPELNINSFENKNIAPMLFKEADDVFNSPDYLYELKFDGIRCLAYLDNDKTTLINKRGKILNPTYPELMSLHQNANQKLILDGELVVFKESKPDFYALQRRSLMTDPLKIKIQMKLNPVIYIAFDLLFLENQLLINMPLFERKRLLKTSLKEDKNLLISKHLEGKGKELFEIVKAMNLEGIVAKEKESFYYPGKRSSVWLKMKVYQEDDLVICGYIPKENNIIDLIMGRYLEGKLIRAGRVITGKYKREIIDYAKKHPSPPLFDQEEAIWMVPNLVGTVRYMMETKTGGLRQPVFVGIRDDKIGKDLM